MTTKPGGDDPLDELSKNELVGRAIALGIADADRFTKLELVDEIRRQQSTDRGLLGKARDLLRGVVERGIAKVVSATTAQLPTAANAEPANPSSQASVDAPAIAMTTVAAIETIETIETASVERARPATDDEEEDLAYSVHAIEPEAFVSPASEEPVAVPPMLDDAPFPTRYDVDECVALAVDPTTLYVYWESRIRTIERARRAMGAHAGGANGIGTSTLRILVVQPGDRAPIVETRDFEIVDLSFGEYFVRDLPGGAIVRAAIGLVEADRFLPLAHTLDVEPPAPAPSAPVAHDLAVWTERATFAASAVPEDVARELPIGSFHAPPVLSDRARGAELEASDFDDDAIAEPDTTEPDDESISWRLGLSSAELQGLRARRRRRKPRRDAPTPAMPSVPRKGLGASDRIGSWPNGRRN